MHISKVLIKKHSNHKHCRQFMDTKAGIILGVGLVSVGLVVECIAAVASMYMEIIGACTMAGAAYGCTKLIGDNNSYGKKASIVMLNGLNGMAVGIAMPGMPFIIPAYCTIKLVKKIKGHFNLTGKNKQIEE